LKTVQVIHQHLTESLIPRIYKTDGQLQAGRAFF